MSRYARVVSLASFVVLPLGCNDAAGPASDGATTSAATTATTATTGLTDSDDGTTDATTAPDATTTTGDTTGGSNLGVTTGEIDGSSGTSEDGGDATTGSTGAAESTGAGDSSDSTGDMPGPPSFIADVWPIVFPECGCHIDHPEGGLYLGKKDAYDNLIGVASTQVELPRVDPGSPETSYMWHKIEGTHEDVDGEGEKMPPGGSLAQEDRDTIRAWIEQGAHP